MIGLDTNILVRYLAQDDPVQSAKATEIFERRLTEEEPGFVSVVAMVETAWVLDRAYRLPDHEVAAAIERMLQVEVLVVESEQEVFAAMIALKDGTGAFADALIAALGAKAGCANTLTFDRKALRISDLSFPSSSASRSHRARVSGGRWLPSSGAKPASRSARHDRTAPAPADRRTARCAGR